MLELDRVDLRSLCEALEDHSWESSWWLDPRTGEVEILLEDTALREADEELPGERGWIRIEPVPSRDAYTDLEDFTARVRDPRARDLLERAIAGRGAFRRFKDTLFEFPELRETWFEFHDVRMERRALRWLADEGLVDREAAERAIDARPDPELEPLGRPFDPHAIAEAVADDLRVLYGERLRDVLLFGSWARGDAHPESDIDLLVVLDEVPSRWDERRRMEPVLWRYSFENDTIVAATPVTTDDLQAGRMPVLARAREEGLSVA